MTPMPSPAASIADMDPSPDWGRGDGSGSHIGDDTNWGGHPMFQDSEFTGQRRADGGPNWQGGNPDMNDTDPLHSLSRRAGYMFTRLSLRR
jgi:hypothetical protein